MPSVKFQITDRVVEEQDFVEVEYDEEWVMVDRNGGFQELSITDEILKKENLIKN